MSGVSNKTGGRVGIVPKKTGADRVSKAAARAKILSAGTDGARHAAKKSNLAEADGMNEKQRKAFHRYWWPPAAKALGVKASDRNAKLRACMWALEFTSPTLLDLLEAIRSDRTPKRWLASTDDLTDENEITHVKKCLGMIADDLAATGEVGRPEINKARQKRDVVRELTKCIGVYHPRPRAYVAKIVDDKFNSWRKFGPSLTIKDLTDDPIFLKDGRELPSQLDQLLFTLSACLNGSGKMRGGKRSRFGFRVAAGDSLHDMKMKAGVRCDCAACSKAGGPPILPPLPEENWADFEPELETVTDEFGGASADEGGDPF